MVCHPLARTCYRQPLFCSLAVLDPRVGFLHLSLSSDILIDSSTKNPVHVLTLSIPATRGLPRLCASGIVPCIISFCFLMVWPQYASFLALTVFNSSLYSSFVKNPLICFLFICLRSLTCGVATVALWPIGVLMSNRRGCIGEWRQPIRASLSPVIEYYTSLVWQANELSLSSDDRQLTSMAWRTDDADIRSSISNIISVHCSTCVGASVTWRDVTQHQTALTVNHQPRLRSGHTHTHTRVRALLVLGSRH